MMRLARIEAPRFVAGLILIPIEGVYVVVRGAPILCNRNLDMRGWTEARVVTFCRRRGWHGSVKTVEEWVK